jgi:hypothetical protein
MPVADRDPGVDRVLQMTVFPLRVCRPIRGDPLA